MVDYTKFKEEWLNAMNESGITNKEQITHDYETTGVYCVRDECMKKSMIHHSMETYVTQNPYITFMKIEYTKKT